MSRAAEESGIFTSIRLAIGEGDSAQAQQLTEKLLLLRQGWGEGRGAVQSAAPERQAALSNIGQLTRVRDELSAKLAGSDSGSKGKSGAGDADAAERQRLQRELSDARQALKDLSVKLKREKPEVATLVRGEPADLAQVQSLLGEDQALVQYLLLEDKGYAFVVKRDTVRIRDLPLGEKELGPLVRRYQEGLTCALGGQRRSPGRPGEVMSVDCEGQMSRIGVIEPGMIGVIEPV